MYPATNLQDVYKVDHRRQYPEGTSLVFSNWTPRQSRIPGIDKVVFFGLQYFIQKYLIEEWNHTFFNQPKSLAIERYRRRVNGILGLNGVTYEHLEQLHDLGWLPIRIMALPEGSRVPLRVPPMVVWNTDPRMFWLTNYLETLLSCVLWQPCTSATIADAYRRKFAWYANLTGGDPGFVQFQGHDFSFRGMSSVETAAVSGAGHLLSFTGTDTIPAIDFLERYYGANSDKELIGASVPATEHSVMCMGGQENEADTFRRLFKLYPTGIVSVVSDTWDYWNVLTNVLPTLKSEILARAGKLVIRPDSSKKTPVEIICGDPDAAPGSPEHKGSIQLLWDLFGGTVNEKGCKVLDPHIGLIYGDSISLEYADTICARLAANNFASTNWVAGIGSYSYQYNTRDTFGWAMKATYGIVDNQPREIFKAPKTDDGTKNSAKGLIAVYRDGNTFVMKEGVKLSELYSCAYQTVFENGRASGKTTLAEIRARLSEGV